MTPTTVLRPVHAWFFAWERLTPSVYRVVATGMAAGITVGMLSILGVHPVLAAVISLPAWIGLAIAQEHDERVTLPPDAEFIEALSAATRQAPLRLRLDHATGPSRARRGRTEYFLLSTDAMGHHPLSGRLVEIERSRRDGAMRLDVFDDPSTNSAESTAERLRDRGAGPLADRVRRSEAPESDAEAIGEALRAAYW